MSQMRSKDRRKKIRLILFSQFISFFIGLILISGLFVYFASENFAEESSKQLVNLHDKSNVNFNVYNVGQEIVKSGIQITNRENYVLINNIKVDGDLVSGDSKMQDTLLLRGFWLMDKKGVPNANEITTPVIFGHRQYKLPPETETFYDLDKLKVGEMIEIGFEGKVYYYEVISSIVVDNSDWQSIAQESFKAIKLVTCTPLGSSSHRIVVTAKML